jgi:DNA-directed RNA polymerase specialized sigma24 family protein
VIRPDVFEDAAALAGLTKLEMLTTYRYFVLGFTAIDIARADDVTERMIRYRIARAVRKLEALPAEHLAKLGLTDPGDDAHA